ncbi:hypothetical protein AB0284_20240 [Pseudarthrobacter phenanthrenivorans]
MLLDLLDALPFRLQELVVALLVKGPAQLTCSGTLLGPVDASFVERQR